MRPPMPCQSPLCLLLGALALSAQTSKGPDAVKELQPPQGQVLLARLAGKGSQIYTCQKIADVYTWKLKAPDARLIDDRGRLVGRHFAGPTWEAKDGSRVTGKLAVTLPSPDPASIPLLLLTAKSHEGHGVMSNVESIQRLDTKGGIAPSAPCGAADENKEVPVPYQASYYFYGSVASPSH